MAAKAFHIAFFGVFLLAACQTTQRVEDRLVLAFGEAMFNGGEVHDGAAPAGSPHDLLARWPSPVSVSVVEGDTAANVALAKEAVGILAALSALDVEWSPARDRSAALRIHFASRDGFVINRSEKAVCYTRTAVAPAGRILQADVYVSRMPDGGWNTECLTHELLHAFGWRGHTHRLRSANSYAHGESELTRWDRIMMRTLYDPRLEPGISKAAALPVARVIIREHLAESEQGSSR